MSDYESEDLPVHVDSPTVKELFRHRGRWCDFVNYYHSVAQHAARDGKAGTRRLAPELLQTISDARMLFAAWTHNAMRGGRSPGTDGRRYSDYGYHEVWAMCNAVGRAIGNGTYRMGREKLLSIPKTSGPGTRPIVLLTLPDRMVQRAATMALRPLFDPLYYPTSFGFRPGRGQQKALAAAERHGTTGKRLVWVCHDFRDAFGSIPVGRLMGLLRGYLPAQPLLEFLERIIRRPGKQGLRQGAALSSDMLNFYVHHHVDRLLSDALPHTTWIRYGDDHLMPCESLIEAIEAEHRFRNILSPTGLVLKAEADDAIVDLRNGDEVDFLGFTLSFDGAHLHKHVPQRAWSQLRAKLARAHSKEQASLRAEAIVMGWLNARGPAFQFSDVEAVCRKIIRTAKRFGFEEIPDESRLVSQWRAADKRWITLTEKEHRNVVWIERRRCAKRRSMLPKARDELDNRNVAPETQGGLPCGADDQNRCF